MNINGSFIPVQPLPFQAAKAYGVPTSRAAGSDVAGMIRPTTRSDAVNLSPGLQNLVAGSVTESATFDAPRTAVPGHVLQMYTRAADKVEAAVAVLYGRTIDLKA